jgi:hypothetical protein
MSPRVIRRLVVAVFVAGIAGMIGGSIADSNAAALTFGILTAAAALSLILVTAVAPPTSLRPPVDGDVVDETLARDIEERIAALTMAGADENEIRRLVRQAIDLGRSAELQRR